MHRNLSEVELANADSNMAAAELLIIWHMEFWYAFVQQSAPFVPAQRSFLGATTKDTKSAWRFFVYFMYLVV